MVAPRFTIHRVGCINLPVFVGGGFPCGGDRGVWSVKYCWLLSLDVLLVTVVVLEYHYPGQTVKSISSKMLAGDFSLPFINNIHASVVLTI